MASFQLLSVLNSKEESESTRIVFKKAREGIFSAAGWVKLKGTVLSTRIVFKKGRQEIFSAKECVKLKGPVC